jgi:hypothetical protein
MLVLAGSGPGRATFDHGQGETAGIVLSCACFNLFGFTSFAFFHSAGREGTHVEG